MSRDNPYAGIEKRRFESTLLDLLLNGYGMVLGGRRIAQLLVEDVVELMAEFFPDAAQTGSGTLVWSCAAGEGKKAEAGKTVTVRLPLITQEELQSRTKRKNGAHEREKRQVARLVKAAAEQGGLLTIAELSVIVNRSYGKVRRYIQEWQEETGELLPLKDYPMD